MMEHESEIMSRPKRTWFVTEKQKRELAARSAQAAGGEEEDDGGDDDEGGQEDGRGKVGGRMRAHAVGWRQPISQAVRRSGEPFDT